MMYTVLGRTSKGTHYVCCKVDQLMLFRILVVVDSENEPKVTNTLAGRKYVFVDVKRDGIRNYHSQLIF